MRESVWTAKGATPAHTAQVREVNEKRERASRMVKDHGPHLRLWAGVWAGVGAGVVVFAVQTLPVFWIFTRHRRI